MSNKLIFSHIRETGGTAMKQALAEMYACEGIAHADPYQHKALDNGHTQLSLWGNDND